MLNDVANKPSTIDKGPFAWPTQKRQFRVSHMPVDDGILIIRE